MKFFTNQEADGLHRRSTLVGSILSAIGVAAGIALLVLIAMSVSFGQDHPTNAQIIQAVAVNSAICALVFAAAYTALGLAVHALAGWLSKGSLTTTSGVSDALAGIAGAVTGCGFWGWQMIVGFSITDGVAQIAALLALAATTGALIAGAWLGLSSLLKIRTTEAGKSISSKLALTAAISSLLPWLYFVLMHVFRP